MNNNIKLIFTFIAGAAIGSVVTWKLLDKKIEAKYAQIADEEITSTKAAFERRLNEINGVSESNESTDESQLKESDEEEEESETEEDYGDVIEKLGYSAKTEESETTKEKNYKKRFSGAPYVILPENFGEFDDYQTISLMYYADHVLADDDNEPIDDIEKYVGLDALNQFGEYADDAVYVRNDKFKCDYEILLSLREYSDVAKTKPRQEMD